MRESGHYYDWLSRTGNQRQDKTQSREAVRRRALLDTTTDGCLAVKEAPAVLNAQQRSSATTSEAGHCYDWLFHSPGNPRLHKTQSREAV